MVHKQDNLFDAVEFQRRYRESTFALDGACLMPLFQRVHNISVINGQDKTRKYDIEGFIPVESLNGVVGLPYSFINYLIGSTSKIGSAVYINVK